MAFFAEYDACLSVLPAANTDPKDGLLLRVEEPLSAKHLPPPAKFVPSPALVEWTSRPTKTAGSSRCLLSHLHNTSSEQGGFVTLGSRILADHAIWGKSLDIRGEFTYIPKYWEWTEDVLLRFPAELDKAQLIDAVYASLYVYDKKKDVVRAFCENWCPATNTLHLSFGEASISLWDLHRLGGLPVSGQIYDEVIPSFTELTGIHGEKSFLPSCCKYLFATYHFLSHKEQQDGAVPLETWINFWFRSNIRYRKPPVLKETNSSRPTSPSTPDGFTLSQQNWETYVVKAYAEIGVTDSKRKDIYLAAFLSCWLCAFVLPGRASVIRPEVFKAASMMASAKVVNLAVPVLAKIYRGLNEIANSSVAGSSSACFPAHFVYGWISHFFETYLPRYKGSRSLHGPQMTVYSGLGGAAYFDPDVARKTIYDRIKWDANLYLGDTGVSIIDDSDCSIIDRAFFMSVRACYLSTRCDGEIIVEPYSPHRFARQLGFLQDVPGTLRKPISSPSFEDLVRLTRAYNFIYSKCKLNLPAHPQNFRNHVTPAYRRWWRDAHDVNYLSNGLEILQASTRRSVLNRKKPPPRPQRYPRETEAAASPVGTQPAPFGRVTKPSAPGPSSQRDAVQADAPNDKGKEPYFKLRKRRKVISSASMSSETEQSQELQVQPLDDLVNFPEVPSLSSFPGTNDFGEWLGGDDLDKELNILSDSHSEHSVTNARETERARKNLEVVSAPVRPTGSNGQQAPVPCEIVEEVGETCVIPRTSPPAEIAQPAPSEVVRFGTDQMIGDFRAQQVQIATTMWKSLQHRISRTIPSKLPLIEPEVQKILGIMESIPFVDSSLVRQRVQAYFDEAKRLLQFESSASSKLSEEEKLNRLKAFDDQLAERELAKKEIEADIARIHEQKLELESTPALAQHEMKAIDAMQSALASTREDLETWAWKP